MKFKSKKDIPFKLTFLIMILGISMLLIFDGQEEELKETNYLTYGLILFCILGYLWLFFGTGYELTKEFIKYTSGFRRGKIKLSEIRELEIGGTYWSGAATAKSGLILKYGKFEELRITPLEPDLFVKKIIEYNPSIKVTKEG